MMENEPRQAERSRLIHVMDEYLEALFARAPGRIRVAPHFRYTEDGQTLPLGAGIWRTLRGRREGAQYFVDPDAGQVEFWGLADEMGEAAIVSIRLKVEGRVIAEAETIVTRPGPFFDPAAVFAGSTAAFHALVEPDARAGREELIRAADIYFDAIELSDGARVPVRGDCRRLVNGVVDSADDPSLVEQGEEHRALDVARQITDGHYGYIEALRDRRYPIVDMDRGLVVCHLVFDHPGDLPRAGGDFPIKSPSSMIFTEIFRVVGGRIEEIWALGSNAIPYGGGSGW
ncbi:MAG TPA: hypothetical protein VNZ43_15320 [Sphingomonadaceae bacterium]|jgi:hypothetical protein|nr:hypothetical protein [Sphingomonadaceae bacterium]